MGFDPLGMVTTAATGGAWSSDGKSGYAQGGKGMLDIYNNTFNTSGFTDFIPGVGDAKAQKEANTLNLAEAQRNREFQERMSSTAYQRAMADMKKAGLNPSLAFQQGGASSPSGGAATVDPASKTGLVNSALNAYTGISAANSQRQSVQQQQAMNESAISLNSANALKTAADAENTRVDTAIKKKDLPAANLKEEMSKKGKKILDTLYDTLENSARSSERSTEQLDRSVDAQNIKAHKNKMRIKVLRSNMRKDDKRNFSPYKGLN